MAVFRLGAHVDARDLSVFVQNKRVFITLAGHYGGLNFDLPDNMIVESAVLKEGGLLSVQTVPGEGETKYTIEVQSEDNVLFG